MAKRSCVETVSPKTSIVLTPSENVQATVLRSDPSRHTAPILLNFPSSALSLI